MGEVRLQNGMPSVHCGQLEEHTKHPNKDQTTYCDGVQPLEPFVELTVRASMRELFGELAVTQEQARHLVAKYGLGLLVDCIGKPQTGMILRVRSEDGVDKVYPLVKRTLTSGYAAVVDAPGFEGVIDVSGN